VKHNRFSARSGRTGNWQSFYFSAAKKYDALIGAVARVLEDEGIELVDSTLF